MSNTRSLYKNIFFTAAFLTGCFFLIGCENDQKTIDAWSKDKLMVEEATKVETFFSQNGLMKARLTAPIMLRVMADTFYVEFPKSLHVDFYDDSTKVETWLDSKYGIYYESLNKVYLRDSVVVVTKDGGTLRSPDLWWDQALGKFYTEKFCTYTDASNTIHGGKGLDATQDLRSVIFNDVTGTMKVKEDGALK